jgi:hypothetical protein
VKFSRLTGKETDNGMAKDRIERDELASKLVAIAERAEDCRSIGWAGKPVVCGAGR